MNMNSEVNKELLNYLVSRQANFNSIEANNGGSVSSSVSSGSSSSKPQSEPSEIRDLPDYIRNRLDEIVEDGQDLKQDHLTDMDQLVCAGNRYYYRTDSDSGRYNEKGIQPYKDTGNESGIGSDSDSGKLQLEKTMEATSFMSRLPANDCSTSFLNNNFNSASTEVDGEKSEFQKLLEKFRIPPPSSTPLTPIFKLPPPQFQETETTDLELLAPSPPDEFLTASPPKTKPPDEFSFSTVPPPLTKPKPLKSSSSNLTLNRLDEESEFKTRASNFVSSTTDLKSSTGKSYDSFSKKKYNEFSNENSFGSQSANGTTLNYSYPFTSKQTVNNSNNYRENDSLFNRNDSNNTLVCNSSSVDKSDDNADDDDDDDPLLQSILRSARSSAAQRNSLPVTPSVEDIPEFHEDSCYENLPEDSFGDPILFSTKNKHCGDVKVEDSPPNSDIESTDLRVTEMDTSVSNLSSSKTFGMSMPNIASVYNQPKSLQSLFTAPVLNNIEDQSSFINKYNLNFEKSTIRPKSMYLEDRENCKSPLTVEDVLNSVEESKSGEVSDNVLGFGTLRGDRKGYVKQYNFDKIKSQSLLALNDTTAEKSKTLPSRGFNLAKSKKFLPDGDDGSYKPLAAYSSPEVSLKTKPDILRIKPPTSKAPKSSRHSAFISQSVNDLNSNSEEIEFEVQRSDYFRSSSSSTFTSPSRPNTLRVKEEKSFLNTVRGRSSQTKFSPSVEIMPTLFEAASAKEGETSSQPTFNTFQGDIKPIQWSDDNFSSSILRQKPQQADSRRVVSDQYQPNSLCVPGGAARDTMNVRRSLGMSVAIPEIPKPSPPTKPKSKSSETDSIKSFTSNSSSNNEDTSKSRRSSTSSNVSNISSVSSRSKDSSHKSSNSRSDRVSADKNYYRSTSDKGTYGLASGDRLAESESDSCTSFMNDDKLANKHLNTALGLQDLSTKLSSSNHLALADIEKLLRRLNKLKTSLQIDCNKTNSLAHNPESFRKCKESLSSCSRRFVTNCRTLVQGATKSYDDFTSVLPASINTLNEVTESCQKMISPANRVDVNNRLKLIEMVISICNQFKSIVTIAFCLLRETKDGDTLLEQLMNEAKTIASSLSTHMNFIKSLEPSAIDDDDDEVTMVSERL